MSRQKLFLSLGLFLGLSTATVLPTLAAPTTYTFTGVGTGFLDGTDFTDLTFSLSLIEDSSGVTMPKTGIFITPSGKASVTLAGFGTGTSTSTVHIFDNQTAPSAGISQDNHVGDFLDVTAAPFSSFDLQSNLGPISTSFAASGNSLNTSLGELVLTDVTGGEFTAASAPVPEASTLLSTSLLLTLGLSGVIAASRKKKSLDSRS